MRVVAAALFSALLISPAFADFYALRDYARMENLEGVKAELAAGSDPNRPTWEDGYTPLMFAASHGDAEMTALLIAAGSEIEARDHNGDRALIWAALWGTAETVDVLLKAGAAADSADDPYGNTPLMTASRYGKADVAKLLLVAGADPNHRGQSEGVALQNAALSGSAELVAVLLEAGADPDLRDNILRETPLHIAAERGEPEVVRLLIEAGAGLEFKDSDGMTPLHAAAARALAENVALLIAAGADGDSPIVAAMSPLNEDFGDPAATALLLAPLTADIDTAFATAIWQRHPKVAEILLARGARLDARDFLDRPALAGATQHEGLGMFEMLLARGADVALDGPAALDAAAEWGRLDIAARLLALGVPVDARRANGRTPMLAAVMSGEVEMVRLLLDHGADPLAKDSSGRDAADYLEVRPSFLIEIIEQRQASRALRPTFDLEIDLDAMRCRAEAVRELLDLPLVGEKDC